MTDDVRNHQAKPIRCDGFACFYAHRLRAYDRYDRRAGRIGKSSAAKALADRLGFEFLDTGAMYRAVAYAALRDRIHAQDSAAFRDWLIQLRIEATPNLLRLGGEDVIPFIRTPEITALASQLAAIAPVELFWLTCSEKRRKDATWCAKDGIKVRLCFPMQSESSF